MKLKEKTKKRIRGSITILLVIILLPMMTLSALIVDLSRVNMAKQMMSSAGNLTMNTALANYDTILKDVYGLFAMSQEKSQEDLAEELQEYFERTLVGYGVVDKKLAKDYVSALLGDFNTLLGGGYNLETSDFLKLDNITVNLKTTGGVTNSALSNPDILRKQIIEYMKYRAPLNFGMGFLDALKAFQCVNDQNVVVEAQVKAQESTQTVTEACRKLIDMIRAYDDLVLKIDAGADAVRQMDTLDDTTMIRLEGYDDQVNKYKLDWIAADYEHINKIALVFLGNAPSEEDVYLFNLDYPNSEIFIKTGGTGIVYENSGIDVTVTLKNTTAEAKQQVLTQIAEVGKYSGTALSYVEQEFLDSTLLDYDYVDFKDEKNAVDAFILFEDFLLDQNSKINYSDVKKVLEEIYKLGKIFDNYKRLIEMDITAVQRELDTAIGKVNAETANKNNAVSTMHNSITKINDTAKAYRESGEAFDCLVTKPLLMAQTMSIFSEELPDLGGAYRSYYETYLADGEEDRYLAMFKEVISSLDNNGDYAAICTAAEQFLVDSGGKTFVNFMKEKVNGDVIQEELFFLLDSLHTCSQQAKAFSDKIDAYDRAVAALDQAVRERDDADRRLRSLKAERDSVKADYETSLNGFYNFSAAYQADVHYYSRYIMTAKNIVAGDASYIAAQFTAIKENVKALREKLNEISKQITTTKEIIVEHNKKVTAWETANNNYESKNDSDSFSKQTAADIETAHKEYNEKDFVALDEFVIALWNEFDDFATELEEMKYGGKKLDAIKTAEDVIGCIQSVLPQMSDVVTPEEAARYLDTLYTKASVEEYIPYTVDYSKQLCFLEPTVLLINTLKYLNSAYPEKEKTEEDKSVEAEYNSAKASLVEGSGKTMQEESDKASGSSSTSNNPYGYTYKGKNPVPTDGLPSEAADQKAVADTSYKLQEEDNKVNASAGVKQQGGTMATLLNGIGDAVTAGLENAYILSYIFENFSYNTEVQDAVIKAGGIDKYAAARTALEDSEQVAKAASSLRMLSNYPKDAVHNYLFGGEAEYILYGSPNPNANIAYAKASIYAIRFGFNCIYAFTNSEIRNSTMAAGLAVQAATLGVVPYQVVQIVLQLALAAAESALDLEAMNSGLKVAIVKSNDTWFLSVSNAAKSVTEIMAETAADLTVKGVQGLAGGLQSLVDASAAELEGAIISVSKELSTATNKIVTDYVDRAFAVVMEEIEAGLNSLQLVDSAQIKSTSDAFFVEIKNTLHTTLTDLCGGNEMLLQLMPEVENYAKGLVNAVQTEVNSVIQQAEQESKDIAAMINEKMISIKQAMIATATNAVTNAMAEARIIATSAVSGIKDTLNGYIGQAGGELSEQAAEEVKSAVEEAVNGYIGDYIDKGNPTAIGGGSTSKDVASMIKFGYKDYLMLFTYLAICVKDEGALKRTADVIQLNIQNLGEGAAYTHEKGKDFKMADAMTYVTVDATAELDMFFLDLDLFQNLLRGDDGSFEETKKSATGIRYKSVLGY